MKHLRSEWIICCFWYLKVDKFYWHLNGISATTGRKVLLHFERFSRHRPRVFKVRFCHCSIAGSLIFVFIWSLTITVDHSRSLRWNIFYHSNGEWLYTKQPLGVLRKGYTLTEVFKPLREGEGWYIAVTRASKLYNILIVGDALQGVFKLSGNHIEMVKFCQKLH